jgi:hypothetical protein
MRGLPARHEGARMRGSRRGVMGAWKRGCRHGMRERGRGGSRRGVMGGRRGSGAAQAGQLGSDKSFMRVGFKGLVS